MKTFLAIATASALFFVGCADGNFDIPPYREYGLGSDGGDVDPSTDAGHDVPVTSQETGVPVTDTALDTQKPVIDTGEPDSSDVDPSDATDTARPPFDSGYPPGTSLTWTFQFPKSGCTPEVCDSWNAVGTTTFYSVVGDRVTPRATMKKISVSFVVQPESTVGSQMTISVNGIEVGRVKTTSAGRHGVSGTFEKSVELGDNGAPVRFEIKVLSGHVTSIEKDSGNFLADITTK